jgi:hypothetical protein
MGVQFVAAVILGLTLIPMRVFDCTCAAPTAQVKTTLVTVAPGIESKWSTRKAQVEVVGNITHLFLELIAN